MTIFKLIWIFHQTLRVFHCGIALVFRGNNEEETNFVFEIKEKIEHLLPISQNLSVITRKWRRCPPLLPCYVNEVSPPDMSSQVSDTLIVVQFWLNKELTVIWQHNYQIILLKSQLLSKAIIINQQILCNLSLLKSTPPNFQYGRLSKNQVFSPHFYPFLFSICVCDLWSLVRRHQVQRLDQSAEVHFGDCKQVFISRWKIFSSPAERFFHLPLKDCGDRCQIRECVSFGKYYWQAGQGQSKMWDRLNAQ